MSFDQIHISHAMTILLVNEILDQINLTNSDVVYREASLCKVAVHICSILSTKTIKMCALIITFPE